MNIEVLTALINALPRRSYVPDGESVADARLDSSTARFIDLLYANVDSDRLEELGWPMLYCLRTDVFVVYLPFIFQRMIDHPYSDFIGSMVSSLRDAFVALPRKREELLTVLTDAELQLLYEVLLFVRSKRPGWRRTSSRRLTELCRILCIC